MITKTLLVAALSIVAAASALANDLTPDFSKNFNSTLSRAEVQAEYVRAKQAGELKHLSGFATAADQQGRSALTRADVTREYLRARNAGELASANAAFSSPHLQRAVQ